MHDNITSRMRRRRRKYITWRSRVWRRRRKRRRRRRRYIIYVHFHVDHPVIVIIPSLAPERSFEQFRRHAHPIFGEGC